MPQFNFNNAMSNMQFTQGPTSKDMAQAAITRGFGKPNPVNSPKTYLGKKPTFKGGV
jgi:hypothetical protein